MIPPRPGKPTQGALLASQLNRLNMFFWARVAIIGNVSMFTISSLNIINVVNPIMNYPQKHHLYWCYCSPTPNMSCLWHWISQIEHPCSQHVQRTVSPWIRLCLVPNGWQLSERRLAPSLGSWNNPRVSRRRWGAGRWSYLMNHRGKLQQKL